MSNGPVNNNPPGPQGVVGGNIQQPDQSGIMGHRQVVQVSNVHPFIKPFNQTTSAIDKLLSSRSVIKKKIPDNELSIKASKLTESQKKLKKSTRIKKALVTAIVGVIGGAYGGFLGFAIGGPVGAVIGGVIGLCLGGGVGRYFANDMFSTLPDKEFKGLDPNSKKAPHRRKWMKNLLTPGEIQLLTLEKPNSREVKKMDAILAGLDQRKKKFEGSSAYKKEKSKFDKDLPNADNIIGKYIARAKDRALPNVNRMLDAWADQQNGSQEGRNKDLREIVNFCVAASDLDSLSSMTYLRDSLKIKLSSEPQLRDELVNSIEASIQEIVQRPLTTQQQVFQAMSEEHLTQAAKNDLARYNQSNTVYGADDQDAGVPAQDESVELQQDSFGREVTYGQLHDIAAEYSEQKAAGAGV